MKKTILRIIPVILLIAALTACSGGGIVEEPNVSFNRMEVVNVGLTGVSLRAWVDVENPNNFTLPMPRIQWDLLINDSPFLVNQVVNEGGSIRAGYTRTIAVPVEISYAELLGTFLNLVGAREAAYLLNMRLSFNIPLLRGIVYPVSHSGTIPIPALF